MVKKMKFEKMFKSIGFSFVVILTVLMIVVSPALAELDTITRQPIEADLKPGVVGPIDPIVEPIEDVVAPTTVVRCKINGVAAVCDQGWSRTEVDMRFRGIDAVSSTKTYVSIMPYKDSSKEIGPELFFDETTSAKISNEGIYVVRYYSVDEAGNKEDTKSMKVTIDMTKPITKVRAPTEVQTSKFVVELTGYDDLSGIARTSYSIDGGKTFTDGTKVTIDKTGIYTIQFFSVDNAGNIGDIVTRTVELKLPVTNDDDDDDDSYSGGSSGGSYTAPKDMVYTLTEEELIAGFNVVLKKNDLIKFKLDGIDYTLSIAELKSGQKASFKINNNVFDFMQRQSNVLDVTSDEAKDIKLVVGTIDYDKVLVTISKYNEPVVVAQEPVEDEVLVVEEPVVVAQEPAETLKGELSLPIKIGIGSLVLILIATFVGFLIFRN